MVVYSSSYISVLKHLPLYNKKTLICLTRTLFSGICCSMAKTSCLLWTLCTTGQGGISKLSQTSSAVPVTYSINSAAYWLHVCLRHDIYDQRSIGHLEGFTIQTYAAGTTVCVQLCLKKCPIWTVHYPIDKIS